MKKRWTLAAAAAGFACAASAQQFPSHPIRWVVPFAPGGPTDINSRILAPKLAERLGQPVLVENRVGAAGNIGTEAVAKAAPDGYTVLYAVPSVITNPFFFQGSPDPKELAPVIQVANVPMVLLASTQFEPKSAADIVAAIKAKPGTVSCGSSGALPTVGCELLRSRSADMIMVLYKGNGPALNALMGGEINLLFDVVNTAGPQVRTGRVRAVATLSPKRGIAAFPDLPTLSETLPGFEFVTWHGVMAPAGTPREIIERWNREIGAALELPDVRARLTDTGFEIVGGGPEVFAERLARDQQLFGDILRKAGVKPQ
ncbi:MAG TPA: tripartite tricarboxylate transporter substrate binding protein [Burkholderiales bacterium]